MDNQKNGTGTSTLMLTWSFLWMSMLSYGFWYSLDVSPLTRSTIHACLSFLLSFYSDCPVIVVSVVSSGYYLSDLHFVEKPIFFAHHLFTVYVCWYTLFNPYRKFNILNEAMIIEGSVPFLNYYVSVNGDHRVKKLLSLVVYCVAHVYFRNFRLCRLYSTMIPPLMNNGASLMNLRMFEIFIGFNYWWTFTTLRKIFNLLKKFL